MRQKLAFIVPIIFFIGNLIPFVYDIFYNRSVWMYGWLITSIIWLFIAVNEIVKYNSK